MFTTHKRILLDMEWASIEIRLGDVQACHNSLTLEPTLLEQIKVAHAEDLDFINILEWVSKNKRLDFSAVEDKNLGF